MKEIEMTNRASPEQVKSHAKALEMRRRWRRDYYNLSRSIRELKESVKYCPTDNTALRALQSTAFHMNYQRLFISKWLADTAYEWV